MNWQRIGKGSVIGIFIAYLPITVLPSTEGFSGIGILSLPLGAFIGGYMVGNKVGGAIVGLIINGMLWIFSAVLLHEGSLAGLVLMVIWTIFLIPLILLGVIGGLIAQRTNKNVLSEQGGVIVPPPESPIPYKTDTGLCPACGATIARDSKFCPQCGIFL